MNTFAPRQSQALRHGPAKSVRPPVTLSVNVRRRPAERAHPAPLSHGHDFSRISVDARPSSTSAESAVAHAFSQNGATQTPGPTPVVPLGPSASVLSPSLTLANDTYTDSGMTSHKNIAFNVSVPIPLDPMKFALVNKIQGTGKLADGTFWKLRMYGSIVDANFPSQQVDSVDADPVYWSSATGRWNYTPIAGGFQATDDPGPPGYTFAKGDATAFKFKIGVYLLSDVPTTTTGSLAATPIVERDWQYSVAADRVSGALSHPAI